MLATRLTQAEDDLRSMTDAFLETQDQLLALYDLTRSARSHEGLDPTLRALATEAARLVNTEAAVAILAHRSLPVPLVAQAPTPVFDPTVLLDLFAALQWDGGEVLRQALATPAGRPGQPHNLLLIPITIQGTIQAALGLVNPCDRPFSSPDQKLARTIAEQAGAQIENILLNQEAVAQAKQQNEMELAAHIQLGLLDRALPSVPGLDLAARSRPALRVGGDFYDFVAAPGRPFIFAAGDVSGKGMPAALLMAMTHAVLQSAARAMPMPTPLRLLDRLTKDLYRDFDEVNMFATVFIGQYDAEQRILQFVNAGHSPVIYCAAGGRPVLLAADSPPVGVLEENLGVLRSCPLGAGDLLIVGTDGFPEARNSQEEMFGYDRLCGLAVDLALRPACEIADFVFAELARYVDSHPQDDDLTLVVVRGVPL